MDLTTQALRGGLSRRAAMTMAAALIAAPAAAAPKAPGKAPAPAASRAAAAFGSDPAGAAARLDRALTEATTKGLFSGVVLVAREDQVLMRKAYGQASREYGVANTPETRFNLASASKMFTSAAIGTLVDAGKVKLDAPIGTYLDATWIDPAVGAKVTVAQLLSHTSGLSEFFTPDFVNQERQRYVLVSDFKPVTRAVTIVRPPGANWGYTNTNFLLLGAIIEAASGQSYDDYIAAKVFAPAGMTGSGALDLRDVNTGYAQGYVRQPKGPMPPPPGSAPPGRGPGGPPPGGAQGPPPVPDDLSVMAPRIAEMVRTMVAGGVEERNNIFLHVIRGAAQGGLYSTGDDMLRFFNALDAGRIVSPKTLALMTSPKPPVAPHWGYGFMMADGGWGHGGGFPGISTLALNYPDGYRVIILSNVDAGSFTGYAALMDAAKP